MKFEARVNFFGLLITAFVFTGCNIFEWTDSAPEGQDLLEEGLDYMFDGEFEAAESLFALGLLEDSLNSDLRYNHAKATLLSSGESIITIVNEIQKFDKSTGAGLEVPFLSRPWPEDQNNLYVTNITIFNDLKPIFDKRTAGSIKAEDIALDIFIANTVKGILRIADTDNNEKIDRNDFQLNLLTTADGNFAFDETLFDSLSEEDINNLITTVGDIINGNSDFLGEIFGETSLDTTAIDSLLDDITGSMEFFYVNTFIKGNPALGIPDVGDPNNPGIGDNDGDGIADDECINQIDDDGDGLIDEDTIVKGGTPGWDWSNAGTPQPCP